MTIHALYVFSVWLHILAAMTWLGGMLFLVLVVVPWLRRDGQGGAAVFLRQTGQRFRNVGWACFAILVVTGTFNLWVRGVHVGDFFRPAWLATPFGRAIALKLAAFTGVLVASAIHDFFVGPRATDAIEADPRSARALRLRRWASRLGRLNALLALAIVLLAVILVRGWPW